MAGTLTPRRLELLRDVAAAGGGPRSAGLVYVYAYLAMWKQYSGATWDEARMYVTSEPEHVPGLCSEVTGAARRLMKAGLIELGESGRRKAERPLVLSEAGRDLLANLDGGPP